MFIWAQGGLTQRPSRYLCSRALQRTDVHDDSPEVQSNPVELDFDGVPLKSLLTVSSVLYELLCTFRGGSYYSYVSKSLGIHQPLSVVCWKSIFQLEDSCCKLLYRRLCFQSTTANGECLTNNLYEQFPYMVSVLSLTPSGRLLKILPI